VAKIPACQLMLAGDPCSIHGGGVAKSLFAVCWLAAYLLHHSISKFLQQMQHLYDLFNAISFVADDFAWPSPGFVELSMRDL
jgi:hypothetical protein